MLGVTNYLREVDTKQLRHLRKSTRPTRHYVFDVGHRDLTFLWDVRGREGSDPRQMILQRRFLQQLKTVRDDVCNSVSVSLGIIGRAHFRVREIT